EKREEICSWTVAARTSSASPEARSSKKRACRSRDALIGPISGRRVPAARPTFYRGPTIATRGPFALDRSRRSTSYGPMAASEPLRFHELSASETEIVEHQDGRRVAAVPRHAIRSIQLEYGILAERPVHQGIFALVL